jgi:hypothetical protein
VATKEVLRELVLLGSNESVRQGHGLSSEQLKVIDRKVAELLPLALAAIDGATA